MLRTAGVLITNVSDHLSDHLPVFYISNSLPINNGTLREKKYSQHINDNNISNLSEQLDLIACDDVLDTDNVNDSYELFLDKFISTYNSCIPITCHTVRHHHTDKPWISDSILLSIKKKIDFIEIA